MRAGNIGFSEFLDFTFSGGCLQTAYFCNRPLQWLVKTRCYQFPHKKYSLFIVILNEQFLFTLVPSLTVYSTSLVLGTEKSEPDCLLELMIGGFPELSVQTGLPQLTLTSSLVALSIVMSVGQKPQVGGSVSKEIVNKKNRISWKQENRNIERRWPYCFASPVEGTGGSKPPVSYLLLPVAPLCPVDIAKYYATLWNFSQFLPVPDTLRILLPAFSFLASP